jgi:ATP-binding cassette subfamily C protein LapB
MQGGSVDHLMLHEADHLMGQSVQPLTQLKVVCRQMGWRVPSFARKPDAVDLPLLCYTTHYQWAVLVDRTPQGDWVLATPEGVVPVEESAIKGHLAALKLGANTGLGLRIFLNSTDTHTFFDHIRSSLRSYKTEILEACVATVFIGFLALATSLYSMQVYDRVIPTRGHETLIVLTLGVILSILLELALKFSRSQIMDRVVTGVDSRLSREVFQRMLQLRVDQMPSSVGTLAGQLRGYEQLRNFYTATTLFTLIDLPLSLGFIFIVMWIATPWVAL